MTNEAKTTTLSAIRQQPPVQTFSVGMTDSQGFELAQRAAKLLAASSLVPNDYKNNVPNCVIALNMASRVGADPLMVMQNLVIVHGRPTWSSQFLISTVNTCGRFTALRYEFFGDKDTDSWGCRAWAIEKATGEKLVGTDITIKLAKDEGWHGRSGSKWKTMPQQMLMYRAGSWWARAYAPELSMGLHTAEEMQDVIDFNPDGSYTVTQEALRTVKVGDAEVVDTSTPAESTDQETGEITTYTFAHIAGMLKDAETVDDVYLAADLIKHVPEDQQAELMELYRKHKLLPKD